MEFLLKSVKVKSADTSGLTGAGKSTTVKILTEFLILTGSVLLNDIDVKKNCLK